MAMALWVQAYAAASACTGPGGDGWWRAFLQNAHHRPQEQHCLVRSAGTLGARLPRGRTLQMTMPVTGSADRSMERCSG